MVVNDHPSLASKEFPVMLNDLLDRIHTRISECFNDYRKCAFGRDDLVLPPWIAPTPRPVVVEQGSPISEKYKLCSFLDNAVPEGAETTAKEIPCIDGKGKYMKFERGRIYWHPDLGAYYIQGKINDKYVEMNCERGALGYPTDDQQSYAPKNRDYSVFEKGVIVLDRGSNIAYVKVKPPQMMDSRGTILSTRGFCVICRIDHHD
jgi:hypothetical protein